MLRWPSEFLWGCSGQILECWIFKILSYGKHCIHHHRDSSCDYRGFLFNPIFKKFRFETKRTIPVIPCIVPNNCLFHEYSIKHTILLWPCLFLLWTRQAGSKLEDHTSLGFILLVDWYFYVRGKFPLDLICISLTKCSLP